MARKIRIELIGDSRSVERAFQRAGSAGAKFNKGMGALGKTAIGAGVSVGGAAFFMGVKAVKAASDLGEQINKTRVVFGKGAKAILAFGRGTANSLGISNESALKFAGTFGNMLVPMGIARQKAAGISKTLVKLSADMASFNNANPEDVLIALQAGLAGETEPLRRFGVFLNQDRIIAEAVSSGIVKMTKDTTKIKGATLKYNDALTEHTKTLKKYGAGSKEAARSQYAVEYAQSLLSKALGGTTPKLTAQQKALATFNIIMKDTKDAQGDFSRTLGSSLPNAMRVLRAQVTDLMAVFGKGLVPVVMKAAQALRQHLADPQVRAAVREMGRIVGETLYRGFVVVGKWFDAHWGDIQGGFRTFVSILRGGVKIARQLKDVLVTITTPLRIHLKILLRIWDMVLGAISTGAGILSHLPNIPGTKLGGSSFKGVQEAVDAAREGIRNPFGGGSRGPNRGRAERGKGAHGGGRARGGPVMAGMTYRVGERGPEKFVPSENGRIVPNGGGGVYIANLSLPGVTNPRQFLAELQRIAKHSSSQTRGRNGGQNLALT